MDVSAIKRKSVFALQKKKTNCQALHYTSKYCIFKRLIYTDKSAFCILPANAVGNVLKRC